MSEDFPPFSCSFQIFLNSVQLCIIPEASCFLSALLIFLPIVLSLNIVVVPFLLDSSQSVWGLFFLMNEG